MTDDVSATSAAVWSQPMIGVRDVVAAGQWYQQVLGAERGHGGDHYEQLVLGGELVLQLHRLDVADHHGLMADPGVPLGNGVALWFEVSDFAGAMARIGACGAEVETPPHLNPNAQQEEIWLRDLDGYRVVVAGPSAYRPRPDAPD